MLRHLLEKVVMLHHDDHDHDSEEDDEISRDGLALILMHIISSGGVENMDQAALHEFVNRLMETHGDWEFEFLKRAVLHAVLHDMDDGHHDDEDMSWKLVRKNSQINFL